jgi:glutamate dehydrogenase/leucine dehydrogenase
VWHLPGPWPWPDVCCMCVQYSSALGPYEGGLHFHKDFNVSMLKSMAFAR